MKTLLLCLLVVTSATAAQLPLAPVSYTPSIGNDSPRAATNGDTTFVVWHVFPTALVEGACLRHDGTVVNAPSILIGTNVNDGGLLSSVLWIGGHYLVLWTERSGNTFARRFAADGSAIDAAPRRTNTLLPWNVITDGTNVMIVSAGIDGTSVQRLDASGDALAPPVRISTTDSAEAAAANANGALILMATAQGRQTLSIGWDGTIRKKTSIPDYWSYATLTEGGGRFLLVAGFGRALLLDGDGTPIGQIITLEDTPLARAAWNGSSWTIVSSTLGNIDYAAVKLTRITADGRIDAAMLPAFGMGINDLVWNGTRFLAVGGGGVFPGTIRATLFDSAEASSGPTFAVSRAAAEESGTAIASTTERSLVVWSVRLDANTLGLRGAFVVDGSPTFPFEIASKIEDAAPAVATDGRDFLVVWQTGLQIMSRTVSSQQVLGPEQQIAMAYSRAGSIGAAWSGQTYVSAFVDSAVHVAPVARDGTLAGSAFVVKNPAYVQPSQSSVSLACDDADCLLATRLVEFALPILAPPTNGGTFAARVSRDGSKADALVRIDTDSATSWPLAMRVDGVSVIVSNDDRKSLSAVRLDAPNAKTKLLFRTVPVRAVSVDRGGLYWSEERPDGSALLHWSSVAARQLPAVTSTVDLGEPMPLSVAASSTASVSHVVISSGATDPELLASRLFVVTFPSPDPRPETAPSRHRAARH